MLGSIFERFDFRRIEDLFFRANPDKVETVSEVRMDKVECPSCKEHVLDAWIYKQNGDWLQEYVMRICHDCQQEAHSRRIGRNIVSNRQKTVDKDWYLIRDEDESGFKNFETPSSETTVAKNKAMEYTKALLAGRIHNLRIEGTTGTGKTHLAKAIARTLKHEGKNVAFITADELFDKIKRTFGNDYERDRMNKQFQNFDVVVIDDVGVETRKPSEVSWTSSEWVRLIDMREGKSTVYTTNFDEKALAGVIGARAESRMSKDADYIKLYTPDKDYRKLETDGRIFY